MQAPFHCYSFLKYFFNMVGIFWQEKCIFDRKFCNYQDKFRKYFLFQRNMNQAVPCKVILQMKQWVWASWKPMEGLQFFNFPVIWVHFQKIFQLICILGKNNFCIITEGWCCQKHPLSFWGKRQSWHRDVPDGNKLLSPLVWQQLSKSYQTSVFSYCCSGFDLAVFRDSVFKLFNHSCPEY